MDAPSKTVAEGSPPETGQRRSRRAGRRADKKSDGSAVRPPHAVQSQAGKREPPVVHSKTNVDAARPLESTVKERGRDPPVSITEREKTVENAKKPIGEKSSSRTVDQNKKSVFERQSTITPRQDSAAGIAALPTRIFWNIRGRKSTAKSTSSTEPPPVVNEKCNSTIPADSPRNASDADKRRRLRSRRKKNEAMAEQVEKNPAPLAGRSVADETQAANNGGVGGALWSIKGHISLSGLKISALSLPPVLPTNGTPKPPRIRNRRREDRPSSGRQESHPHSDANGNVEKEKRKRNRKKPSHPAIKPPSPTNSVPPIAAENNSQPTLVTGTIREDDEVSTGSTDFNMSDSSLSIPEPPNWSLIKEFQANSWDDGRKLPKDKLRNKTRSRRKGPKSTAADHQDGLKVAMTEVAISQSKQLLIQDTLERITGQAFAFKDSSKYEDSGENLSTHYWMTDNQLRVYGVVKANPRNALGPKEIVRRFAITALESYGYHATYCEEALDAVDLDFGRAVEYLFGRGFRFQRNPSTSQEEIKECAELRLDERKSLQAIYGSPAFREVISNRLWKVKVNQPLFGGELDVNIRFPEGSRYPREPPVIAVSASSLPRAACLNITRKLVEAAEKLSVHAEPFVYNLIELLENEEEMVSAIKSPPLPLSLPIPLCRQPLSSTSSFSANVLSSKEIQRNKQDGLMELVKRNKSLKAKVRATKSSSAKYAQMLVHRMDLPAWEYRSTIVSTIASSPVVIIQGSTGCGKSTQVPQYLLDEFLSSDSIQHRSLVCTQPRRISAMAVAGRIAEERAEELGDVVGYHIRLESEESKSTRLLFCTTGVLLKRLESDPQLDNVTHILIDEVHERSEESDFLLLTCRDLLRARPDLRIILMSATIDSDLFSKYFGGAPVITIPGRLFHVEKFFLEDILDKINHTFDRYSRCWKNPSRKTSRTIDESGKPPISDVGLPDEDLSPQQLADRYPRCSELTRWALQCVNYEIINYDLILSIIIWILEQGDNEGSILVFLPGLAEISIMLERLERNSRTSPDSGKCILLPLHSSLSSEEQSKIFVRPDPGVRKIIVATNLAETSITVEDCAFVIDSGRMKLCRYDPNKEMKSLDTVWISVANALQRSGRAGRVRPGKSFHMYTRHRFNHQLAKQPPPEIDLVSLERSIMRCKALPIFQDQIVGDILGNLPEPPRPENVEESIKRLQHLGALDSQGDLTPLGRHLASLSVDLKIGKLLLFGAMFRCVDSALTIAACLSYKSPFTSPWKKRSEAQAKKLQWSTADSDHLTVLLAFKAWREVRNLSEKAGRDFADKNFLSVNTLEMMCSLKQQFVEELSSIGFLPAGLSRAVFSRREKSAIDQVLTVTGPKLNENGGNYPLLLSVLCASFYPQLVRVMRPDQRYNKSGSGAVLAVPHPTELKFTTRNREMVQIHPSSVLSSKGNFGFPYVTFHEKLQTSSVFILGCSIVPAFPLILFGGSGIQIKLHQARFVIELDDGWIKFVCDSHQVAELLAALRNQLDELLVEKIRQPQLDLCNDPRSDALLSTISILMINPTTD